jgi:hypothetical protein
MVVPADASEVQLSEMRYAFMAGAQHLFASIIGMLDAGQEPTDADLRRMSLIDEELARFRAEMELRHGRPGGSS